MGTSAGERTRLFRRAIEHGHGEASGDQIARHVRAHRPETKESNVLRLRRRGRHRLGLFQVDNATASNFFTISF
jgi:hypothetical protein